MFLRVLNSVRNVILKPIYKHLPVTQFSIANTEGAKMCNKLNVPMQGHVQLMYSVYFTESIIMLYILCNKGSNYTIVHSSHAHLHFNCTYAIFNQY